ncbi:MAG TPA: hypothetical protein VNQ90_07970 [Chthoniobacteraceae bacterium]|nr:hypothetical protein [Chthoniobacteraceae bacterium]
MKAIYLFGLFLGLLWITLSMVITYAIPPEEGLARRLHEAPEKWELRVIEESHTLRKSEEAKYNDLLRRYIARYHRASQDRRSEGRVTALVVCVFCVIGWFRERKERRT